MKKPGGTTVEKRQYYNAKLSSLANSILVSENAHLVEVRSCLPIPLLGAHLAFGEIGEMRRQVNSILSDVSGRSRRHPESTLFQEQKNMLIGLRKWLAVLEPK